MESYKDSMTKRYLKEQERKQNFLKSRQNLGQEFEYDDVQQIQDGGITFEFGKVSNRRGKGEIEHERREEEFKVHQMYKRQKIDAYQTEDRNKFDTVQQIDAQEDSQEEEDNQMAGPTLNLFFKQP